MPTMQSRPVTSKTCLMWLAAQTTSIARTNSADCSHDAGSHAPLAAALVDGATSQAGVALDARLRAWLASSPASAIRLTAVTEVDDVTRSDDEVFMRAAIEQARLALTEGEMPYGAVVVSPTGEIVARAHDQLEADDDLTSHAELLVVRRAAGAHSRDLDGCTLYSTVEPCAMCFSTAWTARVSAAVFALTMRQVKEIVPGEMDEIVIDSVNLNALGQRRLEIRAGVLADESRALWDTVARR
jgi:tRNA(adenine34) deaminase